ncbi:Aste57867_8090 [Aphanomyces stellatus]|uniref:Aste57867_8090 protein n=1 Tax=Aphanomyces stellatus TaxID=120398 RepID=A0A485KJF2_9STRA|nr:hypothetical protein As57867_008060 [Aphanomyces stellatus]VFT84979.1 Aste57867_8090 [Aphanomyces stellatus]
MGSGARLPGVDRLIGSLATLGFGVVIYLAHQLLRPKSMTMDEYYRQKYLDPSSLVGHKGSCGCGKLTFVVLAPRSICAFDDSNTFPSKMGRMPVMMAPMTHLQMTSNHSTTDVAVYSHDVSATYATQHVFCKECGIHLFHIELNRHDHVAINVYALESDHIEDLRVVFVPKGAYPIFHRVPPSSADMAALPGAMKRAALESHATSAHPTSAFEKQLMMWATLDDDAQSTDTTPGAAADAEALPPPPSHKATVDDDHPPPVKEPVPLDKIPETELVRMKYQLQYYLQRHLESKESTACGTPSVGVGGRSKMDARVTYFTLALRLVLHDDRPASSSMAAAAARKKNFVSQCPITAVRVQSCRSPVGHAQDLAAMHLPVIVWSNRSLQELRLRFTCSSIAVSHDSTSLTMVCGTQHGALLLFRATSTSDEWRLDCLMLRHATAVAGLVMGINEWGDHVCVSVGMDGAVGVWLLSDGRCLDWKATIALELAPLMGIQMFCNQRYALLYGEQGRMLVLDTWTYSTLACTGTGLEQVRRDVGVGECRYVKNKAHQIDSKVMALGMEGLCKLYNWVQPIATTTHDASMPPTATATSMAPAAASYLWQEESSWILSWAPDTLDMSCIHTRINPQTTFVPFRHFPMRVHLSPNASLVLFIWNTKWAVVHRMWLEPSAAPPPSPAAHGAWPSICPVTPIDTCDYIDGCFLDNDTVLLWTTDHSIYSFPSVAAPPTDLASDTGHLFVFQPQDDMEVPQSVAYPLVVVDAAAAAPLVSIPPCACRRPPFATTTGFISSASTDTDHGGVVISYVGHCGCTVLWHSDATTSSPCHIQPLGVEDTGPRLTVSHAIRDHNGHPSISTPILVHGFDDGRVELHLPTATAPRTLATFDAYASDDEDEDDDYDHGQVRRHRGPRCASAITCLAHLNVTRMVKTTAALYESYADSPTTSQIGMAFQAAKLTKISHLLHKLQHHSLTPRANHPSTHHVSSLHSSATSPETTATTPTAAASSVNLCLLFAGTFDGHVIVSQLPLASSTTASTAWTPMHAFTRHTQPVTAIYVSPTPSSLGTIVASVGGDRKLSLFAVRMDDRELHLEFVMECNGHADRVLHVEWAFQTNHVLVECADGMMYIWSLTTGILERIVPKVMVHSTAMTDAASRPLPHAHVFSCPVETFGTAVSMRSNHALLSYLLTWTEDTTIDALVQNTLGLIEPHLAYSIAVSGPHDAFTLPLPKNQQRHASKWQYSPYLTAQLALALVTMCTSVMEASSQEDQVLWSQLITQIAVVLPERLPGYKEPSLEALAEYGFHTWEASQMASRLLLHGVIKRLPENLRSTRAAAYMTKFQVELQQMDKRHGGWTTIPMEDVVAQLGSYLVVLSILGTCFPGEISPTCARQVCDVLVACLHGPSHVAVVAAELLAKGLLLFRPHLTDVGQLVLQLIPLTLDEDATKKRLKQAAMRLLVEVGTCEASFVLSVLQQEMNVSDRSIAYREGVLVYLMTWVNLQYLVMVRHLPAVVDTVLSCLDPTKPDRRKKCLAMSTKCLHDLVKRFPMVDFHKATQRLAVGTMDGVILLYDLRMATKWRVLEGHTCSVGAVSFRKDGAMLISYGAREAMVRWWNIGSSGLFTLLKVQQSCVRHLQLATIPRLAEFSKVIQTCRFHLSNDDSNQNTVWLTREDESVLPLNFHI